MLKKKNPGLLITKTVVALDLRSLFTTGSRNPPDGATIGVAVAHNAEVRFDAEFSNRSLFYGT